jgi:hypothetical protein
MKTKKRLYLRYCLLGQVKKMEAEIYSINSNIALFRYKYFYLMNMEENNYCSSFQLRRVNYDSSQINYR